MKKRKDTDRDGIPNYLDCAPRDPNRQDIGKVFSKIVEEGLVALPHYPEVKWSGWRWRLAQKLKRKRKRKT